MPQLKRRLLAVLAAGALAGGCQDYTITQKQVLGDRSLLNLPAVGFNHVYGPSPLDSRDAMSLQRTLFSEGAYWEVYVGTSPVADGFVKLDDPAAVRAGRHNTTSLIVTLSTENLPTIDGLLAFPGKPGPAAYGQDLIAALEKSGYDDLTSAQVNTYFSERYEYSNLSWTRTGGYVYHQLLSWQSPSQPAVPLVPPVLSRPS